MKDSNSLAARFSSTTDRKKTCRSLYAAMCHVQFNESLNNVDNGQTEIKGWVLSVPLIILKLDITFVAFVSTNCCLLRKSSFPSHYRFW